MKRILALLLLLLIALVLGCAPGAPSRLDAAALQDIGSIQDLQTRFAQDAGKPRLVLLVSPT